MLTGEVVGTVGVTDGDGAQQRLVLRDHVRSMTDEDAGAFVHAVAARLPLLELDYVRLNIVARRAG